MLGFVDGDGVGDKVVDDFSLSTCGAHADGAGNGAHIGAGVHTAVVNCKGLVAIEKRSSGFHLVVATDSHGDGFGGADQAEGSGRNGYVFHGFVVAHYHAMPRYSTFFATKTYVFHRRKQHIVSAIAVGSSYIPIVFGFHINRNVFHSHLCGNDRAIGENKVIAKSE